MQAVMGQVALMMDGRSDVGAAGASRADRAMERYACGEDAAFGDVYDELAPRLHRFALRWTRSRSAAEDAVQQTLLQIHAARHRFARGAAVVPWAYAIARRLLIDLGRRGVREVLRADDVRDPEEPSAAPSPEEALHHRRVAAEARRNLASLPSGWREAFELVKFEGLSVAETAEVLGITRGMVKIRAHRATAALREEARRLHGSSESTTRPALRSPRDIEGGTPT
ncbi:MULTISPECIES: RNA polymerase sigma factor [Anaeromyxobacter]|uniref:RNA polymerase sigma factor n=1 Tax=Anaeromyxobacter TaxID=161492 RepID=UPI001F583C52|nr:MULTISPECIES: sigma-70 family RNA polymerase sigma factor [unclassified Anaeromyxobacter]